MSIRQRVAAKAPKFNGQKSGIPIESTTIQDAADCRNFYLHNGQLVKVNGSSLHGEALIDEPGGITSIHNFKDSVIVQRGTHLAVNASVVYSTTYTDALSAGSSLTSTKKFFSAAWRNQLVLVNTQDAYVYHYNDTSGSFKRFGLDPPEGISTSLALFVVDGAGNVDQNENYYLISLYDSATNTESPCMGALPTADGIFELSPNGFLGPTPSASPNGAGSTQIMVYGGLGLKTRIDNANTANQGRATHFIVYRAGPKVGGLYTSFRRVPLKDGGTYDGNVILPISALRGDSVAPLAGQISDFVDNTAYASLPAVSPPENNSPPPTPERLLGALSGYRSRESVVTPEDWLVTDYSGFRHVRFFRDQLFGIGAKSYGFTVSQDISFGSNLTQKVTGKVTQFNSLLHGSEVYQPDYWPYRWDVGVGDGQEAVALGVLGDVALLCFKEFSTYYLSGSSPDNYVVRIMDPQRGAVHQGPVQETPLGVISLDKSGFVLWNKIGQGQPISEAIQDIIESIDFVHCAQFYSCYDAKLNIYRCSVATTGAVVSNGLTVPNLTCILDLNTMQWTFEQGSEGLSRLQFSVNSSNITSIAIANGEAPAGTEIDVGKVYDLVGSATNGRIYDYSLSSNVTNPGEQPIEAVWTSGTINFGDDQHKKRMKWVYLRAKSQTGWKVNIEIIPDYDEARKFVIENWDVVSSQSLWYSSDAATDGSLLWDSGTGTDDGGRWASDGLVRQVTKIPVSSIGYSFQIRIIHKETDATRYGFAMESVSAEAVQLGR